MERDTVADRKRAKEAEADRTHLIVGPEVLLAYIAEVERLQRELDHYKSVGEKAACELMAELSKESEGRRQEVERLRQFIDADIPYRNAQATVCQLQEELRNLTAKLAYAAAENKRLEKMYKDQNYPKNTGWTTEEKQS